MTHPARPIPLLGSILLLGAALPLLAACSGGRQVQNDEYGTDNRRELALRQTGAATSSGLVVFGVDRSRQAQEAAAGGGGMTVNAFL